MKSSPLRARLVAQRYIALTIALLLVGSVGAVVIFMQRLPAVPISSVQSNCDTLTSSPETVPVGSSGFVIFYCEDEGGQATPAFIAPADAVLSPTFVIQPPWVNLSIYRAEDPIGTGPSCSSAITGALKVASGANVTFLTDAAAAWNYCGDYADASGSALPSVEVVWNVAAAPTDQQAVIRFDFPAPCLSYVESRHTGRPDSIEFWIYVEEGNSHDLEGWAIHTVDGDIIFSFDLGVASPPTSGTQTGAFQFYVTHPGLEWPSETEMRLFCK